MKHCLLAATLAFAPMAQAQLAVSANDNKVVLENGTVKLVPNAAPDTVAIIDLSAKPPRLVAEIEAGASVVGPPVSVAVAPDESFALVTVAMRNDPADMSKQYPDNKLQVIDLKSTPPRVIQTLEAGAGAAGVSVNRKGTLALVANRSEGTVSIFTIAGNVLTAAGKIQLGDKNSGPSHVAISPGGTTALVTRDGDSRVSMLSISGDNRVEYAKRDMFPGQRPYGIDFCGQGTVAVVANVGMGQGDDDTVSLIDMSGRLPRVVDTISVGPTPEGVICSPDGKLAAATVMSGSNKPKESPMFRERGKVVLIGVQGRKLVKLSEADVGNWSQGSVFSSDGKTLLVQNMVQKEIQVFEVKSGKLRDTGQRIKLKAGPVGLRIAER